jgi:hypothetical protein
MVGTREIAYGGRLNMRGYTLLDDNEVQYLCGVGLGYGSPAGGHPIGDWWISSGSFVQIPVTSRALSIGYGQSADGTPANCGMELWRYEFEPPQDNMFLFHSFTATSTGVFRFSYYTIYFTHTTTDLLQVSYSFTDEYAISTADTTTVMQNGGRLMNFLAEDYSWIYGVDTPPTTTQTARLSITKPYAFLISATPTPGSEWVGHEGEVALGYICGPAGGTVIWEYLKVPEGFPAYANTFVGPTVRKAFKNYGGVWEEVTLDEVYTVRVNVDIPMQASETVYLRVSRYVRDVSLEGYRLPYGDMLPNCILNDTGANYKVDVELIA